MQNYRTILLFWFTIICSPGWIKASPPDDKPEHLWEIGLTFGEIPFMSGSFKPGVTLGYHFNENVALSATIQLRDYLQRDDASFNARNTGFDGLLSSNERTGERMLFAIHYRPADWSPYLIAGFVYNGKDLETMKFDHRSREIGTQIYDSEITIVQQRERNLVPAIGFGYRYDFENGISLNTNIAVGIFTGIPSPKVDIRANNLSPIDKTVLSERSISAYQENFHNHYHVFNLGFSYRL